MEVLGFYLRSRVSQLAPGTLAISRPNLRILGGATLWEGSLEREFRMQEIWGEGKHKHARPILGIK